MAKKYYAVKVGLVPGIYESWDECKPQVDGFPNAKYKSFKSLAEAQSFLNNETPKTIESFKGLVAYTDGSYLYDNDYAGYGVVFIRKGAAFKEIKGIVKAHGGRQVNGELEAVKNAVQYAIDKQYKNIKIVYDYQGVENWANKSWQANKSYTEKYVAWIEQARTKINIEFQKVEAHSGNAFNEIADQLAKEACEKYNKERK